MKTILLDDFLDGGIIREKSFRKMVDELDFELFRDQKVIIKTFSQLQIPNNTFS